MKTLTLIIPAFNEGNRIQNTINTLEKGFNIAGLKLQKVIFVNDGSIDHTLKVLKSVQPKLKRALNAEVVILSNRVNQGRGFSLRKAALATNTDYVVYTDADFSIPLSNLKTCMPNINQGYDLIFGSKKKPGAVETIPRSAIRRVVGYGHSVIISLILGVFAWDYQGGFKVFSRKLIDDTFKSLTSNRWGFDMEIIFLAKKLGYKNAEIPVVWGHYENDTTVSLYRDIKRALADVLKIKSNWYRGQYSTPKLNWRFLPYLAQAVSPLWLILFSSNNK